MTHPTGRLLGAGVTGRGIVHLGAGAFARAHTWWATALAVDAQPGPWGVTAVAQRSPDVVRALRSRDWRYDVRLLGEDEDTTDTVAVVAGGLVAADEPDRLLSVLISPDTRVLTVTATEAGYPVTASGDLAVGSALVAADLAGGPPRSLVGQVALAAAVRGAHGAPPLTVLVCDNVQDGGRLLRRLATRMAQAQGLDADEELARWAFPTSVVDRVVPAVAPGDEPDVLADPTFRWVLEDDFAGPRPAWERAGVLVVPDAGPWQLAKLLLVNAPHSLIAYLGLALGHTSVGAAMADPVVRATVVAALEQELADCVPAAPGLDAHAEAAASVRRFTHQLVPHELRQVGAGGSNKLPQRLGPPLDSLRRGAGSATWSTLVIALWVHAVERGLVEDPRTVEVHDTIGHRATDRAAQVLDLLALGTPDPHDPARQALSEWLDVLGDGDADTVRGAVASRGR